MRVSYNWLKDYVNLDGISPASLGDRLTMVGLEVDDLSDRYGYLDTVVAARIESVAPIPESEHLKVCQVDAGGDKFQVVCGAPNAAVGLISALIKPGTELPGGQAVGRSEIRGAVSDGMLASAAELVVGPDASGLIELPPDTPLGRGLKKVLGLDDWTYEIGITPNRPDCLCVLGVAREVAGLLGRPLTYPEVSIRESGTPIGDLTSVRVLSPDYCPRYVARVIRDVKIGPSPFWMVDRLAGVGQRSISNVVDITNFVLFECGQPLHAFDMDQLAENRIVVRTAEEGSRFTTLDNNERIMTSEMLMICDAEKPVGLAGVMGGLNSEITSATRNVLLESAYFDPVNTRRTSKNLGLSTEASFRFERGCDIEGCPWAADRATALMADMADGVVAPGVIDELAQNLQRPRVSFSSSKCNAFLGMEIEPAEMARKLEGIGLPATEAGPDRYDVEIPGFRVDLLREVDLFEEVARLAGYDLVPATLPPVRAPIIPEEPSWTARTRARTILEGLGYSEIINYSFIAENFGDRLGLPPDDGRRHAVRIINPLSEEQTLMRTTLVPCLLDTLGRNQSFAVRDAALYEVGAIYLPREGEELPEERWTVAGLLTGSRHEVSWDRPAQPVDYYDLKGAVEELLEGLGAPEPAFDRQGASSFYSASASARITAGGRLVGELGRISARTMKRFNLNDQAYVFELDLAALLGVNLGTPVFRSLPRFPGVTRDLAVNLSREIEAARVTSFIKGLNEEHLSEVGVFDAFEGDRVGAGRKSLGFRLHYRSPERTLTDEEVNQIHQRIMGRVLEEFSATLQA